MKLIKDKQLMKHGFMKEQQQCSGTIQPSTIRESLLLGCCFESIRKFPRPSNPCLNYLTEISIASLTSHITSRINSQKRKKKTSHFTLETPTILKFHWSKITYYYFTSKWEQFKCRLGSTYCNHDFQLKMLNELFFLSLK